ncbi:MAG TPA: hypothetical protein VFO36_05490 [Nitrospiraceae bacterium]|nr:hypothetical protein [Nitrospiraceae bacterium]
MLRRNFDLPPLTRLLQASVLMAFAAGIIVLAIRTEVGAPRIAREMTALSAIAAP